MVKKTLKSRFKLRYDTLQNWESVNPILETGEVAVVIIPSSVAANASSDITLFKIGDGVSNFNILPYASGLANEYTLKGYSDAENGQMLVKGADGIEWKTPVSIEALNIAVQNASNYASNSANAAVEANSYKVQAETAAGNAQLINQTTMNWISNKFWWGTVEEYNALESITEGTFYFIKL